MSRYPVKPLSIMVIAGEPSGDELAAELIRALRAEAGPFAPTFFGAGGEKMAAAGVEIVVDLTRHAVIGLPTFAEYRKFQRFRDDLAALAAARAPDVVVGVDFFAFNGSLAERIRTMSERMAGPFQNWRPKLVQYVSPQVWASRAGRARRLEHTHDLLLSILPFEPAWYAANAPRLRVEFVGHPIVERHGTGEVSGLRFQVPGSVEGGVPDGTGHASPDLKPETSNLKLLLLPGSRAGELRRHLPVMVEAARRIEAQTGVTLQMVLPNTALLDQARPFLAPLPRLQIQIGGLSDALRAATVALASTGTVTLECAWSGVPTVAIYRTSRITYELGKRLVTVKSLAMPNLLAGGTVMPEFIQHEATPENLARATLALLADPGRRATIRDQLAAVVRSLGGPGASRRAARAVLSLL